MDGLRENSKSGEGRNCALSRKRERRDYPGFGSIGKRMGTLRSLRAAKMTCFAATISRCAKASFKQLVRGDGDRARNSSISLSIG